MASKKQSAPATRSAKIAASWNNKKVRAARMERVGCRVGRTEYSSLPAAFRDLGIELWRVIPARAVLKAEGKVEVAGHTFKLVK